MTYTKSIELHDRITVDGTDVSNAFRSFGLTSTTNTVDVSGFSVSGADETLSGSNTQSFQGDVFLTPEIEALLWPLHNNRTVFEVAWQPNGLTDNTRETYHANCQLREFSPTATRGDVAVFTATFSVADSNGVSTS